MPCDFFSVPAHHCRSRPDCPTASGRFSSGESPYLIGALSERDERNHAGGESRAGLHGWCLP